MKLNTVPFAALVAGLISMASLPAFSSDHWDNCSSADGNMLIENGQPRFVNNGDEASFQLLKLVKKTVISKKTEKCKLKNSGQVVISYTNEVTVELWETQVAEAAGENYFICERGGSGIPAADECK